MLVRAVSGLGSGEHTTLSSDDLHAKAEAREKVWANEQDKAALLKLATTAKSGVGSALFAGLGWGCGPRRRATSASPLSR